MTEYSPDESGVWPPIGGVEYKNAPDTVDANTRWFREVSALEALLEGGLITEEEFELRRAEANDWLTGLQTSHKAYYGPFPSLGGEASTDPDQEASVHAQTDPEDFRNTISDDNPDN